MTTQNDFTDEQKNYLQGYLSGVETARAARGAASLAALRGTGGASAAISAPESPAAALPSGPDAIHFIAQNRVLTAGGKLCPEELAKRKKNALDMWDEMEAFARDERYPKGTDVFMVKFHGMFYVAPAQTSYMCRLRMPGGILSAQQLRGVADIAEQYAGHYAHVTTRANLQLREIGAASLTAVLTALQDIGLTSRGSGADNIRNVTGSPTAGIDPQELIDTRPLARQMHHYILNHREMYGLPRKFNIAFDGGGVISALEDTNDIGFAAVRVAEGREVPAGVYFRLQLGGITGHQDFARDTGVLLAPDECVPVAAALVRVFIENGDRTDRKKARLKYVLDRFGIEKYLTETELFLPFKLRRFALAECEIRPPVQKHAHIGIHPQSQPEIFYTGVALPVGRLTLVQMRGLAAIAERYGSATLRLTVWQNLLISDLPASCLADVKRELEELGLDWNASGVRAGLIACTGNAGCRLAASDTKRHALEIVDYLEARLVMTQPVNIHLTGCHNSCAQHYIGDIGLLGAKVEVGDDLVEGYHVYLGGGYGETQSIAREIYRDVAFNDIPPLLALMLSAWQASRSDEAELFQQFCQRHTVDQLKELFADVRAAAA